MEVILKEDVEKLGRAGEKTRVAEGYGRNYLIPQGLAVRATPSAMKIVQNYMKKRAIRLTAEKAEAKKQAEEIGKLRFEYLRKAGDEGKLYGSVTASEIVKDILIKGFTVDKRKVLLDMPLKYLGEHKVKIKLHPEVITEIRVDIKMEEEEVPILKASEETEEK